MRQRLLPTQLAVGLSNGAETLVHACREWIGRIRDREDIVLLQKDIKNASNELLPVQFIQDARQFAPASARFVEWCYGANSHLIYRGRLESSSRGQQGCPLIMALFCLTRKCMAEAARVAAGVHPKSEPEYADDAFSGGLTSHVLRSFQEEIHLAAEFGLRYDLEQCILYLLSGEHFRGDVSGFQALGIRVVTGPDVQILKAPVGGSEAFLREFCEEKQRLFETHFQALETYPLKHEAFHLFQQCTGFNQLNYLARATPRSLLLDLCEWDDMRFKRCFENILGQAIPSIAWQQACLPASSGGLGLMTDALEVIRGTCHKSDLAFLVACHATRPAVDALLRSERVFVPLGYEIARDELMPHLPNYAMALQECNGPIAQKEILPSLFEAARRHLVSQVCLGGAARIQSCTRSWSAAWVCAQPSAAFDTGLSDDAFVDAISM